MGYIHNQLHWLTYNQLLRLQVAVDLINYSQNSVGVAGVIYSAEKQKRVSYESSGTGLFHQQL